MSTPDIQTALRTLADKEAIRDLAHRYAHHVWQNQVSAAVDLFTDDGEMNTGERPVIRGKCALLEEYKQMLGINLQPFVHNHVINLQGDRATGTCYLDVRATVNGKSMIGSGFYDDVYVRVGEEWKFRSRKLTMAYFVPLSEGWARDSDQ